MTAPNHEFVPPSSTDGRSPCPALNALANHGYLPHDGKNITAFQLISSLRSVYGVSLPLATILSVGGIALCGHGMVLDLESLRQHNKIEHDASMVHRDVAETHTTSAVNQTDPALLQALIDSSDGHKITLDDFVRFKAMREENAGITNTKGYASNLLKTFSRGEPILITEILGKDDAVSVERIKAWLGENRLPEGYHANGTTGLVTVHRKAGKLGADIDAIHASNAQERRDA